jgi:tagatose 6-phosphate kinase
MITCVNLNSSIDKLYIVKKLVPGTVMRVEEVSNTPGGKGLNVAKIISKLGEKVRVVGFYGGYSGKYLLSMMKQEKIQNSLTLVSGETRSCINIKEVSSDSQTEFLEPGPVITKKEIDEFLETFKDSIRQSDIVTISGSIPGGLPRDFYGHLISLSNEKGKRVILDTSDVFLKKAMRYKPFMIKPNLKEMEMLTGQDLSCRELLLKNMRSIQKKGVNVPAVSLGKEGVFVQSGRNVWHGISPDIPLVNSVGCGDSMVAGFAVGFSRNYTIEDTISLGVAVSTANALVPQTGSFRDKDLKVLLKKVRVKKIL